MVAANVVQNGEATPRSDEAQPGGGIPDTAVETRKLAEDMHGRCKQLLEELQIFQSHLREIKKETRVEVKNFKAGVHSEMRILDKLVKSDPADPKTVHGLRSSNFSFYSSIWSIAKSCRSVIGLEKKFYKIHAQADIISDDGVNWTKVSSVTEKRIIWDLAKAGWVDSSGESDDGLGNEDDGRPEGLLKQVEALLKASKATVIHGRHPKVTVVLPKINAVPDSKEVGMIIQKIRDMGVTVQTSEYVPTGPPLFSDAMRQMAADRYGTFSDTLNIDCTILLAFASDLSHGQVEPASWHNKAIQKQIELETEDLLMPNHLWPACGARKLICTRESAIRMQEIVETIGTETERKRTSLLLGLGEDLSLTREQIITKFLALTTYAIPSHWSIPIQIVDVDMSETMSKLPPFAQDISSKMTPINQSVFLFGWANSMTMLSSNGAVAKLCDHAVEESNDIDSVGPDIWLSPSSRSLVGKEKQRRGLTDKDFAAKETIGGDGVN